MFKKGETENIIMFICFMLVILYGLYNSIKRSYYLDNDYAYTIGKTVRYQFAKGFKNCIEYTFFVNDKKYDGCVVIDPEVCCPLNKFYRVKYSKIKPEICEMYLNQEVKDSSKIMDAGLEYEKR